MFQSKLFLKLFLTYVAVIFFYMFLCIAFLFYENNRISDLQSKREREIQLDEICNIVEQRILTAQNIVQDLSYSTAMKQLYMSEKTGGQLDSYALFSIQNEMRSTMAMGGLSIYQTVLFVDGSNKAYSSAGVISLSENPASLDQELPCMMTGTVSEVFRLNSSRRLSFNTEYFLYCDSYSYQTGSDIGTMCVLFDLKQLRADMDKVLGDGYGAYVLYEDQVLLSIGNQDGKAYSRESDRMPGIVYKILEPAGSVSHINGHFLIILLGTVSISAAFVALAFWVSRRYYMPIGHLEEMISPDQDSPDGEMEKIICGIQNLIGEKNEYREKMLTITPYARTGMLHSMIAGNAAAENVDMFLDENYLDLIKPYYVVSVFHFAFEGDASSQKEAHRKKVEELFKVVAHTFSTDEMHMVWYFRDIHNVFLILNFETEQKVEGLFGQIHKYVSTATEGDYCYVTIGVDMIRDDIGELREACEGALKALDGILTDGWGAVYFLEDMEGRTNTYYFPDHFRERLKRCLLKQDKMEIHTLLFDVYKTNLEIAGTSEMYRALIDELHLAVIKTLREITELNTVHLNIQKYTSLATLQDIFDYYDTALLSVIDMLHDKTLQEDSRLEEEIAAYIDAHYLDPDLSLQSLTDRFNVSNKYLSLLCKERFGVTYLQYVQTKRIQKAVELLQEGTHSLTEVCTLCGYTNQLTFRRNFKSITGMNPSVYQQKSTTPLQATGNQASSAASSGVFDPHGIRQMDADTSAWLHCPRE